jgi:hypothetical protein
MARLMMQKTQEATQVVGYPHFLTLPMATRPLLTIMLLSISQVEGISNPKDVYVALYKGDSDPVSWLST